MRSYDHKLFDEAFKEHPKYLDGHTAKDWFNGYNRMYEKDGSVGLLTYEYPGVYTGHWFFKVRGRAAINLAREMLAEAFDDGVEVVRGLTPRNVPQARWGARQIGMTSHGFMDFPNGECEVFTLTKKEFEE